jgi:hypothetical protein
MRFWRRLGFAGAACLAFVAGLSSPVAAQQAERRLAVDLKVGDRKALNGQPRVAIASYPVSFVVGGKATGIGGGFGTRAELSVSLQGVGEPEMRQMANEAYADLAARLTAAGIPVVPAAEFNAEAKVATLQRVAGNSQTDSGIFDSRAKKILTAYGSDAAPLIRGTGDIGYRGAIGLIWGFSKTSTNLQATILMPRLIVDFMYLDANRVGGGASGAARVNSNFFFSIAKASMGMAMTTSVRGSGAGAFMEMRDQVVSDQPLQGELLQDISDPPVNIASILGKSRVDAFRVSRDAWIEQVRAAYRGYNQATVDAVVAARSAAN